MSNWSADMWLEQTTEQLQETGKYDCYKHETHYSKDCESCETAMDDLREAIKEEENKLP